MLLSPVYLSAPVTDNSTEPKRLRCAMTERLPIQPLDPAPTKGGAAAAAAALVTCFCPMGEPRYVPDGKYKLFPK